MKFYSLSTIFCASFVASTEGAQSPFLKEILQGRCYFQPPDAGTDDSAGIDGCPETVGSIMSVLEGHKDADIQSSSFDPYIERANFLSTQDNALYWLHFLGTHEDDEGDSFLLSGKSPPRGLMTPEDTPGGAMLKDLVFCGVDQNKENCKKEESKAFWSFWEAAYREFASHVSGTVQIVVEPNADASFLTRNAVPYMDKDALTEVTIFTADCSNKQVTLLTKALPIDAVGCKEDVEDLVEFMLCQDPSSPECVVFNGTDGDVHHHDKHEHHEHQHKRRHHFFWKLLFLGLLCGIVYYFYFRTPKSGYENLPQTANAPPFAHTVTVQ